MTPDTVQTNIRLKPGDIARLAALARKLGYTQTRGAAAGKLGSVSQLMQALAADPPALARAILEVSDEQVD